MKLMAVDDELSMRMLLRTLTKEIGLDYCCCDRGDKSLGLFLEEKPDIVVLDVMMPDVDGYEVCRRIRAVNPDVPVLFLSARGALADKRSGFQNGGDDYLVKPFEEEEFLLRVEALLRRRSNTGAISPDHFSVAGLEFNLFKHEVDLDGHPLQLTPKEYLILHTLALHPGEVLSKDELVERVWGKEYLEEGINMAAYIRRLRAKIEPEPERPRYLKTKWGFGYYFDDEGVRPGAGG